MSVYDSSQAEGAMKTARPFMLLLSTNPEFFFTILAISSVWIILA